MSAPKARMSPAKFQALADSFSATRMTPSGLFVVRRRGRWWDGFEGGRDRWQREIGLACMFTRRSKATSVAAKVGGHVHELVLVEVVA